MTKPGALKYSHYFFYKVLFPGAKMGQTNMLGVFTTVLIQLLMILINSYFIWQGQDIEPFLENLKISIICWVFILFQLNEHFNSFRLQRFYNYVDKSVANPRYNLPEEEKVLNAAIAKAKSELQKIFGLFIVNCSVMTLLKAILELVNGRSWKVLPFPWPISPDKDGDLAFYSAFLFQAICGMMGHCLATTGTGSITILTQINGLFDTILVGIEKIEERAQRKMKEENITFERSMLLCIKESFAHHSEVVEEVISIIPHLEFTFLIAVSHISIVMACETYPFLKGGCSTAVVMRSVAFLIVQSTCSALVCDRNEIMSYKNTEISWALYDSDWYNRNVEYQKMILQGLTVSSDPLTIKGLCFRGFIAARETFYSAVVSAFNMLNVIRRFI